MRYAIRLFCFLLIAVSLIGVAGCKDIPIKRTRLNPSSTVTKTQSPAPSQSTVFLPNGALPDTAYSAPPQASRFYKDVMLGLTANDNYGKIYPYIGGTVAGEYNSAYLYGFCDAGGRIVCDPVYGSVRLTSDGTTTLYYARKNTKNNGIEEGHIVLSSLDGKWAKRYENAYDSVDVAGPYSSFDNNYIDRGYICVKLDGKWGLIDYSGKEILPFKYPAPFCFSEGLAPIILPETIETDNSKYVYINIKGETVLGPYSTYRFISDSELLFLPFQEGKAYFSNGSESGYITKDGTFTKEDPDIYTDYMPLAEGITYMYLHDSSGKSNGITVNIDSKEVVYNNAHGVDYISGRLIILFDNSWSIADKNGDIVFTRTGHVYRRDKYLICQDDSKSYVSDINGNTLFEQPKDNYIEPVDGDLFAINNNNNYTIVDKHGKNLLPAGYQYIDTNCNMIYASIGNYIDTFDNSGKLLIRSLQFDYIDD